jgi:hypothetical protein
MTTFDMLKNNQNVQMRWEKEVDDKCVYIKNITTPYGTHWKTKCGHGIYMEAPIKVGFSFAPLPNEGGKFCHYCGKEIEIRQKVN